MRPQEDIAIYIDNNPIQPHNGKRINRIIVSQEINSVLDTRTKEVHETYTKEVHGKSYIVTYSEEDNSIRGWSIDIDRNGQQELGVYFKLEKPYNDMDSFLLYRKTFIFRYSNIDNKSDYCIIDLNNNKGRLLQLDQLKQVVETSTEKTSNSVGFLPNGDLVLVLLNDELNNYKVYKYFFANKPTTTTLWECSQIYDIEVSKNLKENFTLLGCFIYQTKLFLFDEHRFTQWDLPTMTMTFEMQYLFEDANMPSLNIVMNKNKTLLASVGAKGIDIFSMKTGMRISSYGQIFYTPVEFVTLKDGSEGLIVNRNNESYKFLDPFLPSDDTMDIIDVFNNSDNTDVINNPDNAMNNTTVITKSNRKFFITENHVYAADGLNKDAFQQILNKTTYHSNIYTLPILKTIQNMLETIIENNEAYDIPAELSNGKLFRFNLENSDHGWINIRGSRKLQNNSKWNDEDVSADMIFSYKQLDNQDLALITNEGILIYTLINDSLKLRYFWSDESWNDHYKKFQINKSHDKSLIQTMLNNEFNQFKSNLLFPLPLNFIAIFENFKKDHQSLSLYKELILSIINNPVEFSEFGLEILEMAIDKKEDSVVQPIFDKIFELIKNNSANYMILLPFISLNLPKLCDHYYSNLVMKYLLHTSFIIDPSSSSHVKHSTNTSLYAYSKDIYIRKSIPSRNIYFKGLISSLYKTLVRYLKIQQQTPVISFIVPYSQICKYQDGSNYNNPWNELLYKPKSILFCNIDSNDFYKWWNFAAIIDFKWKSFGRTYYFFISFFYIIFFLCFALASTLEISDFRRSILFINSILLGIIHLSFEIRQCFWKPNIYFNDAWNLFDVGAYCLPIITSICWLATRKLFPWLTAISNLLLYFKFLLFFRIRQSFGIYFAIMIGVARKVFPFLVVLFFIALGFAHAFFITLKPMRKISLNNPILDNDINNPWNLAIKYNSINPDGTISPAPTLIQSPDSNTNMFSWFPTSLLAMYLLLTGDSESLSLWTYRESPIMTTLLVLFTFFTVIYLMNLFIGLLNMAIDDYNKYEEFLLQKAKIIMEIELFYMTPRQRLKEEWFPDWIYYDIPVNEVRKLIFAVDNNQTKFDFPPFISEKLRKLVEIPDPTDESNAELKRQTKDMEEKLRKQIKDTDDKLGKLQINIEKYYNKQAKDTDDKLDKLTKQMKNIQESLGKLANK